MNIVTLCTGNVARSVMLSYMLAALAEESGQSWLVRSAGTHATEGWAMSSRTRDALLTIQELGERRFGAHRSHQLTEDDAAWADVILASEYDHVNYVRAHFPDESAKAVQLAQFVRRAPRDLPFDAQLRVVSRIDPSPTCDVADPAGGDQSTYDACASQLFELARAFSRLVSEERTT